MKLVTVEEMRAIEQSADANGLTYAEMMQNAGQGLAQEVEALAFGEGEVRQAFALVGSGNNGGDALVALTALAKRGWRVCAYTLRRKPDDLLTRLAETGAELLRAEEDPAYEALTAQIRAADVLIDGLLGTGVSLPLKPDAAGVLAAANRAISGQPWSPPYVVAVDCPSGVDCQTGEAAPESIPASVTVCMGAVKTGLLKLPAFELAGELRVAEIGLREDLPAWKQISLRALDSDEVQETLPPRALDSHKGTFGTLMVASGSVHYTGAVLLAGRAAYRAGVGLVQMAVPGALHSALAGQFPEATWLLLPNDKGFIAEHASETLFKNLERATALLLGPGMGTEETTGKFLQALLTGKPAGAKSSPAMGFVRSEAQKESPQPLPLPALVLDADALRLLAKQEAWSGQLPPESILTPHPGEMSALTGLSVEEIQADRLGVARKYAAEWGQVVVLKGAFTVIAAPDGRAALVPVASPALARAGTGDVLAGLIGGFRAQGMSAFDAACAGAWIHAQAGLYAAEQVGAEASVLAGDVLQAIPDVMSAF
jgi:NAD(P)H-hydrate epimerase